VAIAVATAAGCGSTTTVTKTKIVTTTVTTTVTKQATPPPPRVFVSEDGTLVYKPDTISLGASSAIIEIRWLSYGGTTALGKGVFPADDCKPNCAEGMITRKPVTVRLNRRVLCQGELAYELWAIRGGGFDNRYDLVDPGHPC
jgi:hypothetical protein